MTTNKTDAGLDIHDFGEVAEIAGDRTAYFSIGSPSVGHYTYAKYKVTEDHYNRQEGRVAIDFTVETWTPSGWQKVMTFKDQPVVEHAVPIEHRLVTPTTAQEAAEAVHHFLHKHHHMGQ